MPTDRTVPPTTPPDADAPQQCGAEREYRRCELTAGHPGMHMWINPTPPLVVSWSSTGAPTQLALPFLAADDVATIDAARAAVDRAHGNALAARRFLEADELERLGTQL